MKVRQGPDYEEMGMCVRGVRGTVNEEMVH